jgi:glycosyltransferase involved in cell wall biosynthesis
LSKIRVVTLVDRVMGGGGGERIAASVTASLDPDVFDRTLCVTRPSSGEALEELRAAGVTVIELERRRRYEPSAWLPLVRHVRRAGADILHSHKFGSNAWSAVAAPILRIPTLVTHEHSWAFAGDRRRILVDRYVVAPRAAAMVAVSELDARRMTEIVRIPPAKIRVIPNGVELAPAGDRSLLRRELGLDEQVPVVGFVGSLRPEKRVDLIVDAAASLVRSGRRLRLVLVGSGPEKEGLRRRAAEAGIDADVSFLGYRPDAVSLAAGFDVAVLSSDREGAPLAVLEYMGLGLAIVSTRVGGVPELVEDGTHGLLVPPGDAGALAEAIGRVLDDAALRERLGAAAAARQVERYSLEATTRAVERLYLELLGRVPGEPEAR